MWKCSRTGRCSAFSDLPSECALRQNSPLIFAYLIREENRPKRNQRPTTAFHGGCRRDWFTLTLS